MVTCVAQDGSIDKEMRHKVFFVSDVTTKPDGTVESVSCSAKHYKNGKTIRLKTGWSHVNFCLCQESTVVDVLSIVAID